jgi:ribosome biogenesis protein ERB1
VLVGGGIDGAGFSPLHWFDLDAGSSPHRSVRAHREGANITAVSCSQSHPLVASAGSDGVVGLLHAQVYADLSADPVVSPLPPIGGPGGAAVTDLAFHPTQPWVFCGTAAGTLSLYV